MRLMKGIAVAGVSSLVVAMSYGCSSTVTIIDTDSGTTNPDGSIIKKDSAPPGEGGPGQDSAPPGACGPVDTTAFSARPYSPPSGKHQALCTTPNLTDYVSCITGVDKTKCAQFGGTGAAAGCGKCIETGATDAKWGPLVSPDGKVLNFNVPGCLDLVVPGNKCGASLDASYGCQDFSCSACDKTTTPDFSGCVNAALKKQCKTYGDTVTKECAAQFGDSAPADINNCFPDSTIADPKAQQSDWIKRIATYFCGP